MRGCTSSTSPSFPHPVLSSLELSHVGVDDACIEAAARAAGGRLAHLELRATSVTDAGLRALSKWTPGLRSVDLG